MVISGGGREGLGVQGWSIEVIGAHWFGGFLLFYDIILRFFKAKNRNFPIDSGFVV